MTCTSQVFIPLVLDYPNLAGDGTVVIVPVSSADSTAYILALLEDI